MIHDPRISTSMGNPFIKFPLDNDQLTNFAVAQKLLEMYEEEQIERIPSSAPIDLTKTMELARQYVAAGTTDNVQIDFSTRYMQVIQLAKHYMEQCKTLREKNAELQHKQRSNDNNLPNITNSKNIIEHKQQNNDRNNDFEERIGRLQEKLKTIKLDHDNEVDKIRLETQI